MTLLYLFSKAERTRRKELKAQEKDRRNLLKDDRDIKNFILWYFGRRYFKLCSLPDNKDAKVYRPQKDMEVNFVWLGYEVLDHYQRLVQEHPFLATITDDQVVKSTARRRVYPWVDNEGNWNCWERAEMEEHYQAFLANESKEQIYGDYTLFKTGPHGSCETYPACAYLSYAYHEEIRWMTIIDGLIRFMAHID